jgi:hypothetical protein
MDPQASEQIRVQALQALQMAESQRLRMEELHRRSYNEQQAAITEGVLMRAGHPTGLYSPQVGDIGYMFGCCGVGFMFLIFAVMYFLQNDDDELMPLWWSWAMGVMGVVGVLGLLAGLKEGCGIVQRMWEESSENRTREAGAVSQSGLFVAVPPLPVITPAIASEPECIQADDESDVASEGYEGGSEADDSGEIERQYRHR